MMLASAPQELPLGSNDSFAARVFQLTFLAILGYLLFQIVRPFLEPIFWASLLALLLFPVNQRLRRRFGGRRTVAATVLTLVVTLGIVVPAALVGIAFARQGVELGHRLSETANRYQIDAVEDLLRLPIFGNALEWLHTRFGIDAARVQQWVASATLSVTQFLVSHGRQVVLGAFGLVGSLTVMLFTLFFCFRDGDDVAERLVRVLPMESVRKQRLVQHLRAVTEAVVLGTI